MKFKKNVISNLILHAVTIITGFFTSILMARGLGTENQGQFSYYLLIFGIIASYGGVGIISATSYFIKRTNHKKESIINNNISVLTVLSIIYIICIVIFQDKIFANKEYQMLFIWCAYAIILLFNNFLLTIYVADENIYIYNKYFIIIYLLRGIIIVGLYYTNMLTLTSISILYALLEFIKIVILLKGLKIKYKFYINATLIKEELKYGIPLYLAGLLIYLNYRVDQIAVKQTLGNSQLGIYSIAVHLADLAFIFPDSIKSAFEGKLYGCKKEDRKTVTVQIIKIAFYVTLIICTIGILCKPLVSILYGIDYEKAGTAMMLLLIGIPFVAIGKVAPAYFSTKGNTKYHLIVSGIVLIINVCLNTVLIPKVGINGAAIASSIAYMFFGLIYIILLRRDGIAINELLILKKNDFKLFKDSILNLLKGNKKIGEIKSE